MKNRERAASVADLARQFAEKHLAAGGKPETIAADLIAGLLHWTMRESEMAGDDGRKPALAAARRGLSRFIDEVHAEFGAGPAPECHTLITIRTEEGMWVSETGYEEYVR